MPDPKLTALITALMFIAGAKGASAGYDLGQLQQIERHIVSKDCGGLHGYLQQNPEIMDGGDPLAQELRSFSDGVEGGLIECLSAQTGSGNPGVGLNQIY